MKIEKNNIKFNIYTPDHGFIRVDGYYDKFDGVRNAVYSEDFAGTEVTEQMKEVVANKIVDCIIEDHGTIQTPAEGRK